MALKNARGSTGRGKHNGNGHHKSSASSQSGEAVRIAHDLNNVLLLAQFSREERLVLEDLPRLVVAAVVRDTLPMLRSAIGPNVCLRVDPQAPRARIRARRDEIKQLLLNLVLNASDAMPQGGEICIRVAQESSGTKRPKSGHKRHDVVIEVTDTGTGMAEGIREKAFLPFFTTKPDAKGLGLTAAQRIAERLGGRAALKDAPTGTCIQVHIPCATT